MCYNPERKSQSQLRLKHKVIHNDCLSHVAPAAFEPLMYLGSKTVSTAGAAAHCVSIPSHSPLEPFEAHRCLQNQTSSPVCCHLCLDGSDNEWKKLLTWYVVVSCGILSFWLPAMLRPSTLLPQHPMALRDNMQKGQSCFPLSFLERLKGSISAAPLSMPHHP